MKNTGKATWAVALLLVLASGCVERKIWVRSEPVGAPVWVDEEKLDDPTPVSCAFGHYGRRRIRVGPIRDDAGRILYVATEREVEIKPPWYERFPLDFFFEALWPWTLVDEHEIEIRLKAPSELPQLFGEERAAEIVREAEAFRHKALTATPEEED